MRAFADLFRELDQTTSTNEKVHIMVRFLRAQDPETAAWSLYFLSGRRPKKTIGGARMRDWIQQEVGYSDWLMAECYAAVGDTAEMISLIASAHRNEKVERLSQDKSQATLSLAAWMEQIFSLKDLDEPQQKEKVIHWWHELDTHEIFILNKFLTGSLRVGVSETLVLRALEEVTGLTRAVLASRIFGSWKPSADFFRSLALLPDENESETPHAIPIPFCLAAPLDGTPEELGDIHEWLIEWKWDGIRCQIVKSNNTVEVWSRGEERITDSFPDLVKIAAQIPGNWILDGELVAGIGETPLLFQELQRRLNRKKPSLDLQKQVPISYVAYDLLRSERNVLSSLSLNERRVRLKDFLDRAQQPRFRISAEVQAESWNEIYDLRKVSREKGAEGLMIKKRSAPYETGRKRGIWFKWKIDPLTLDAVLTSAQPGTGRRASLYTDYTFSIWKGEHLVPIAKAYSGLTDAEIRSLDHWIRQHTVERFGPVRALEPSRVFEIGFEGIGESRRHKSGFAVRFPRILRERTDKSSDDADTVETLESLLQGLRADRDSGESNQNKESIDLGQTEFSIPEGS